MPNLERAMVCKSNSLVEASYRLSVAEQRIVLACVSQVEPGEPVTDEVMYSVSAQDIAELSETDRRTACRDLQEAALRLKRREVRIEKEANGNAKRKKVLICGWVQSIMYVENEGRVDLRFNKDMLPYLTELSTQFTKYKLKAIAKMDSAHAIRLYEMLMQWQNVGRREVALDWLREAFQLGDKYPSVKDFKKWVIDVALAQINEHSDLTARYEQRKTGRNVTHFIFTFAPKEDAAPPAPAPEASPSPLVERLKRLGIGAKLAGEWAKQDAARAQAAAAYVEEKIAKGEVKGKAAGYLRKVFESGGQIGESAFEAEAKARRAAEAAAARRAEAEARARKRAEEEAENRARQAVAALPPEVLRVFAAEYRAGEGAGLRSWDAQAGQFRDTAERLQFKAWLAGKFKSSAAAG